MKSGFIAIIGRPNVGKSTFLNHVVGKKIAIMSNKPQTTRNTIRGILTTDNYQMVFIDTPGIHKPHNELGARMTNSAYSSTKGVDAIIWMISCNDNFSKAEEMIATNLKNTKTPIYLVINKIDLLKRKKDIENEIAKFNEVLPFKGIYPISALDGTNVEILLNEISNDLEEGPMYYPKDMITDHPERFLIGEIIREKVIELTKEEIPHSIAVTIDQLKPQIDNPDILDTYATIYVERDSQKGILIGKGGEMLKKIGTLARKEINNLLGNKIYLDLWVKVKPDWRNSNVMLKSLGYDIDSF